jgi:hypothetical protein
MKREYDFSKATRGRFFRPRTCLSLPVYLDDEALACVQRIAQKKGMDISDVVIQLILTDKRLAEMAG